MGKGKGQRNRNGKINGKGKSNGKESERKGRRQWEEKEK